MSGCCERSCSSCSPCRWSRYDARRMMRHDRGVRASRCCSRRSISRRWHGQGTPLPRCRARSARCISPPTCRMRSPPAHGWARFRRSSTAWGAPSRTPRSWGVTRRFSVLGIISVCVLLVTGIVNACFLVGSFAALFGTPYGRMLIVKLAVFAAMLALAAHNRWHLTPQLAHGDATARRSLRRSATLEVIGGVAIVAIVGALGTMIPGAHQSPVWPFTFALDLSDHRAAGDRSARGDCAGGADPYHHGRASTLCTVVDSRIDRAAAFRGRLRLGARRARVSDDVRDFAGAVQRGCGRARCIDVRAGMQRMSRRRCARRRCRGGVAAGEARQPRRACVASPARQPVLVDCARDSGHADAGVLAGALRNADLGARAVPGGASKRCSGNVARTPRRCCFDEHGARFQLRAARAGAAHAVGRTRAGADRPVLAAAVALRGSTSSRPITAWCTETCVSSRFRSQDRNEPARRTR